MQRLTIYSMPSIPMNILAINTAFAELGLSLMKNGALAAHYYAAAGKKNGAALFRILDEFFSSAQMGLEEVDLYVVVQGPGSFTGIRSGMTVAKTLAQVHQKPTIGVNSLELLAAMTPSAATPFYVLLNCTRSEVFYAQFQVESQRIVQLTDIRLTALEDLWETLAKSPVVLKRIAPPQTQKPSLFDQLLLQPIQCPTAQGFPLLKLGQVAYEKCQGNFPVVHPLYFKKEVQRPPRVCHF